MATFEGHFEVTAEDIVKGSLVLHYGSVSDFVVYFHAAKAQRCGWTCAKNKLLLSQSVLPFSLEEKYEI